MKPKQNDSANPKPTRKPRKRHPGFLSLRWRFMPPLVIVVMLVAMLGAYVLALNLAGGLEVSQVNVLLQSSRTITDRTSQLYGTHRLEAQRVAFTIGVPEAVRDDDPGRLQPILESLARINNMDSIILTGADGREVLGLQRRGEDRGEFALSTATDLSGQTIVRTVLDESLAGATGFLRTPAGVMLFTGVPVYLGDEFIGGAFVGQRLDVVLSDLKGSAVAELALYGPEAVLLQTTLPAGESREPLALDQTLFTQILLATRQVPVADVELGGLPYQVAYQPFTFGSQTLGVVAALLPDNVPFVTEMGRQLAALMAAGLAGAVVIVAYAGVSRISSRVQRVTQVASALTEGERAIRTEMQPTDEIGAAGYALDRYAEHAQKQQDSLQQALRRQRREINHLVAVLEALPDGVVVQDLDGRVVVMNDHARGLLGSQRIFRSSGLHELADLVGQRMGAALAPGIYTLGDPHRIALDDRILSAQAAAVTSLTAHRLGTVILLRDITIEVKREQERDVLMQRLARDIQMPLAGLGRAGAGTHSDLVRGFAREVTRQAVALQKMIIDLRELNNIDIPSVKRRQRSLNLETLVWAVANEWRQVALASELTLHVMIERRGLYVLGDEKRLRWAIGNVIDNAIKYTLPGGALTLEIRAEADGLANLRVRDNGVGIGSDERTQVFTRFYRGNPTTPDGQLIRVPGMGQGLYIARTIFESHGGCIYLKSTQGVGTAVYMSVPLTAPVRMELPHFDADMDGETVRLPEDVAIKLNRLD